MSNCYPIVKAGLAEVRTGVCNVVREMTSRETPLRTKCRAFGDSTAYIRISPVEPVRFRLGRYSGTYFLSWQTPASASRLSLRHCAFSAKETLPSQVTGSLLVTGDGLFVGDATSWQPAEKWLPCLVDYISRNTVCTYITDAPIGGSCRTEDR